MSKESESNLPAKQSQEVILIHHLKHFLKESRSETWESCIPTKCTLHVLEHHDPLYCIFLEMV
jgi:hypothetical protein